MKKSIKILCVTIFIAVCYFCFNSVYAANPTFQLKCDKETVNPAEEISIQVIVDKNLNDITGIQIELYCNKNLEIISIDKGTSEQIDNFDANCDTKRVALNINDNTDEQSFELFTIKAKIASEPQQPVALIYLDFEDEYSKVLNEENGNQSYEIASVSKEFAINVSTENNNEENNQNSGNEQNADNGQNTDNNGQSSTDQGSEQKDNSQATTVLPQTGTSIIVLVVIAIGIIGCIIINKKKKQYKY